MIRIRLGLVEENGRMAICAIIIDIGRGRELYDSWMPKPGFSEDPGTG